MPRARLFRTDIVLEGNAKGAVGAVGATRKSLRGLRTEQNRTARSGRRYTRSLNENIVGLRGIGSQLTDVTKLFGGLTVGIAAFQAIRLTDAFDDLNARLRVVTNSTSEYMKAQEGVFRVSQETFTSLRVTSDLYGRLARSLSDLNVSQVRTLELSRTINQSFQVSGATTQEATSAIIQLAQGLAAGALRGDEFRSVSEQGIRVLEALREGLGKTQGELRKMANAGELTTKRVLEALESQAATINEEFAELPLTMARASQQFSNAVIVFLGEANKTIPVVRILAKGVQLLANNLNLVFNSLIVLVIAWKTGLLVFLKEFIVLSAAVSGRMALLATNEAILSASTFTVAGAFVFLNKALIVTGRVLKGLLLLTVAVARALSPILIVLGAIAGAVFSFRSLTREIGGADEGLSETLELLRAINKEVDEFSRKEITKRYAGGLDTLNELLKEQVELEERLRILRSLQGSRLAQAGGFFPGGVEIVDDPETVRQIEIRIEKIEELSQVLGELAIRSGRTNQAISTAFAGIASSLDTVNSKVPDFVAGFSSIPTVTQFIQDMAERIRDLADASLDSGLGKFQEQIEEMQAVLDPSAKATLDFKKRIDELQKTFLETNRKGLTGFRIGLELASKILRKDLADALDKVGRKSDLATNALERLQQAALKFKGELDPLSKEVAKLIKEQDRLFDLLQKAGPQGVDAYNAAMLALNKSFQQGVKEIITYSKEIEKLFKEMKPSREEISKTQVLIELLTESLGAQHPIVLQLVELLNRLELAYISSGHGADRLRERLGLFGGQGATSINTFADLLGSAFDDAVKSRSFKNFFKAIIDGFKAASDQGGEELAAAFNDAAQFAAFAVEAFRNNPDAPFRAVAEIAAQVGGIVGEIAQAVLAIDSIVGGRLLGTNFEVSGSGRNLAFGAGGFGGFSFIEEERQRSFFRGTSRRRTETALDPTTLAQLDEFFDQVAEAMQASARELGVNVPMLIAGEFAETFDEDGNLVSSISTILGRTFQEGFEQFVERVLAENILAVVSQAVGDVLVTQPVTLGGRGFGGEDFGAGFGIDLDRIVGETTVLMNEVQAIAERWRDDSALLLEGAQFLLLAQSRIQDSIGLLLDEGGLTATADLVEELSFAGETLSNTFLRLVDSVSITEDVIELFDGAFAGTREEFVRFADDLAQAAGGIERLGSLFRDVLDFFFTPEEALGFRIQGAQRTRDTRLTDLGIDPDIATDAFRELLAAALESATDPELIAALLRAGAAIADLAILEEQLADIRQDAIDAQLEAAQEMAEALADIMRDVDDRIASLTFTDFQQAVRNLIIDFHDMTRAALEAGAGIEELARIEVAIALEFQQLVEQLRFDTIDLAAQLFGTPLEEIERRISELQGRQVSPSNTLDQVFKKWEAGLERIKGFLDDLFLDSTLSPLNPRQRLNEAERQFFETLVAAQGGDIDALGQLTDVSRAFLEEAESFFPRAGGEFRGIFDLVISALSALGVPTGVGGTGDQRLGLFTAGDMTLLADLLAQRDILRAEQQSNDDARLFSLLFANIRDLIQVSGEPLADILAQLGIDPFELADRLGIDVSDISALTDAQLRDLANRLGVEFVDLGDVFGEAFGELTDPNSRVNNALENTIDDLPPDIRAQLLPLLGAVESAVTAADARQAIRDLEFAVAGLPAAYQLLLAPFLPDIDAVSPVRGQIFELQNLNKTQVLALAELQAIGIVLARIPVDSFNPVDPPPGPTSNAFIATSSNQTLGINNSNVLVEIQRLLRDGLPTDPALAQEDTTDRVAIATEAIANRIEFTRVTPPRTVNPNRL